MTEIVDALAELVSIILLARGHLGHGEIRRIQCNPLGIDADENLRDGLHVQIGVQIDESEGVILDTLKPPHALEDIVFIHPRVLLAVGVHNAI